MSHLALPNAQRGATLVVGLMMLVAITLMVTAAFTLSTSNLKAVGNMQFRNEALAAANVAIERVISSPFTNAPVAETINVDMNNNGSTDYIVSIATPVCVRAYLASDSSLSSVTLSGMSSLSNWNTVWDIDATVTDATSGASVRMHLGTRKKLSQTQKDSVCS